MLDKQRIELWTASNLNMHMYQMYRDRCMLAKEELYH